MLALSLVTVFATTAIDKSGNQHPPSSVAPLVRADLRARHRVDPDPRPASRVRTRSQWSQREFVLAARAQGATNRRIMVREVLPNVLPAMFSIALLGDRGRDRRRRRALDPRCRRAPTGGVVGQHDRRQLAATCRPCRTSLFEPIVCIFFTVLSLNYLGDVVRARFDVRESAL